MALQPLFQKHKISTEVVVWKVIILFHCCYFTDVYLSSKLYLSSALKLSPGFKKQSVVNVEPCPEAKKTIKKFIQM